MTFEHRVVCGLDDIKFIVFECKSCGARVSVTPQNTAKPPAKCPNDHGWNWNAFLDYQSTESPFIALLSSLRKLADPDLKDVGFKVLIEFEKPKDQ